MRQFSNRCLTRTSNERSLLFAKLWDLVCPKLQLGKQKEKRAKALESGNKHMVANVSRA